MSAKPVTIVFNLFGGPGTGKSVSAGYSFSLSKDDQFNSEYVQEKAKEWAWEKRQIELEHQFELFSRQSKREKRLHNEASVVFADSPVWLCAYYSTLQGNFHAQKVLEQMCKEYYEKSSKNGIIFYNIWLHRVKPYNPKGRFQNEEGAKQIDVQMKPYLEGLGIKFLECPGVKEEVYKLVRNILSGYPEAKVDSSTHEELETAKHLNSLYSKIALWKNLKKLLSGCLKAKKPCGEEV